MEMEEDVRYNVRCVFQRGSDTYRVLINSATVSEASLLPAAAYTVDSISITVSELAGEEAEGEPAAEDPYILIDNPSVYTKGRIYPQKFSAQAPGALPEVNVPEAVESDEIRVYVNTTKIEMSHAPVVRDKDVYKRQHQFPSA